MHAYTFILKSKIIFITHFSVDSKIDKELKVTGSVKLTSPLLQVCNTL